MKAQECGINTWEAQGHGCSLTLRHAHLKMGILLHKQATVRFILILAVCMAVQYIRHSKNHLGFFSGNVLLQKYTYKKTCQMATNSIDDFYCMFKILHIGWPYIGIHFSWCEKVQSGSSPFPLWFVKRLAKVYRTFLPTLIEFSLV